MTILQETIELALKDRQPELHASLKAGGRLRQYAADLADQISSQAGSLTLEQRRKEKWDNLGAMECAKRMRTADHLNREALLAEALESPPDETSPPSQD
jgi:hypothetical protein